MILTVYELNYSNFIFLYIEKFISFDIIYNKYKYIYNIYLFVFLFFMISIFLYIMFYI